ncbi:hypothetical protein CHELA40_10156 [Chelatococcus asaccharovorans]|nr:hypothetical protein CHELA40_10156 [Chelatococcus asaccharovorans]CAH1687245.1 hypothetical protein CHELA17_65453 [Chelatococcus asaccharovorans]
MFAYGSPSTDEYARRMAERLKLSVYPTISVIAPRTDRLTEEYRMARDYWPKGIAQPRKPPVHYLLQRARPAPGRRQASRNRSSEHC